MSGARAWNKLLRGEGFRGRQEHHSAGLFGLPAGVVATNLSLCPIEINEGPLQPDPANRRGALNFTCWVGAQRNKFQTDLESPQAAQSRLWRSIRKVESVHERLQSRRRSGFAECTLLLIFTLDLFLELVMTEESKISAVSAAYAEV